MKAWTHSVLDRICPWLNRRRAPEVFPAGQNSKRLDSIRRNRSWSARSNSCEGLEGRALLATSGLSAFAVLPGQVAAGNQTSQVVLHLGPGELRADQTSTVVVGFVVEAANGSSISPEITRATGPNGPITPISIPNRDNSATDKAARQTHLFTRVIPLANQSQDITLNVAGLNKTTGNYIVEAYLAGDVNGDGTVDATDLNTLNLAYGSRVGQVNYTPGADFNGDGRIGHIDRTLLASNIGAHVVAAPLTASATTATPSPIVPLAAASLEVNLVPQAVPTVSAAPITITTPGSVPVSIVNLVPQPISNVPVVPVAIATPSSVPVSITPNAAIPVTPASMTTPVVLTPVYASTGAAGSSGVSSATPVYLIAQPVGMVNSQATAPSSAPIFLYGQPVVGGASASGIPSSSPASALFGQTTSGQSTTSTTPVPVYLYNTPTSSPIASGLQVAMNPSSMQPAR